MRELEEIVEEIRKLGVLIDDDIICVSGRTIEFVIRKHMNDGWIPVNERLPEERNLYLATAESEGAYYRLIAHWNAPGWTEETGRQKIIAWRPLPEPYCLERSNGGLTKNE